MAGYSQGVELTRAQVDTIFSSSVALGAVGVGTAYSGVWTSPLQFVITNKASSALPSPPMPAAQGGSVFFTLVSTVVIRHQIWSQPAPVTSVQLTGSFVGMVCFSFFFELLTFFPN
jgi:hypothetical protein